MMLFGGMSGENYQVVLRIIKIKLREEGGQKVLEELETLSEKCSKKALEKLKETIVYYRNNVERMDYPGYERAWYHITSSPTESACRHVVGDRLKRSGMRWTEDGAQYVTSLRLKWKNNEWEGYCRNYRSFDSEMPRI